MKLNLIEREKGLEYSEFPKYRIDTLDGCTVAEVFATQPENIGVLLASAPELLEALKMCLKELSRDNYHNHMVSQLAIGLAEQAIAKAEGK